MLNVTKRSHFLHKKKPVSLQPIDFIGGADRDRTDDLMTASHALSQLSYSPTLLKKGNKQRLWVSIFYFEKEEIELLHEKGQRIY